MPADDSPAVIVARFLRANNYNETLAAFVKEAGLPPDVGTVSKDDLTIEKILQEKKVFDLSINFEKVGIADQDRNWRRPAPTVAAIVSTLPTASNILHASINHIVPHFNVSAKPLLLASTADRRLNAIAPDPATYNVERSCTHLQDSPILSYIVIAQRYMISSSMSGKLVLYDFATDTILEHRRDHLKYVVQVVHWQGDNGRFWVATAGWDAKVLIYETTVSEGRPPLLGAPIAAIVLPTSPEALLFIKHPDSKAPLLLLTRRDSTFLYYYKLSYLADSSYPSAILEMAGKQNLAPHSNAWIAFTPSAIALCPTDPSVLAVATSAVPHMKLVIVRLLLPPLAPSSARAEVLDASTLAAPSSILDRQDTFVVPPATQASQAREALALQDREAAAILIHCTTLAPQTPYSTPALAWRPDGSGVWVNSDDGVVRGIEAATGKVVAKLEGHEIGSKIRCLWAGWVELPQADGLSGGGSVESRTEEWVVSGGFDQRLIVWRVAEDEGR